MTTVNKSEPFPHYTLDAVILACRNNTLGDLAWRENADGSHHDGIARSRREMLTVINAQLVEQYPELELIYHDKMTSDRFKEIAGYIDRLSHSPGRLELHATQIVITELLCKDLLEATQQCEAKAYASLRSHGGRQSHTEQIDTRMQEFDAATTPILERYYAILCEALKVPNEETKARIVHYLLDAQTVAHDSLEDHFQLLADNYLSTHPDSKRGRG